MRFRRNVKRMKGAPNVLMFARRETDDTPIYSSLRSKTGMALGPTDVASFFQLGDGMDRGRGHGAIVWGGNSGNAHSNSLHLSLIVTGPM